MNAAIWWAGRVVDGANRPDAPMAWVRGFVPGQAMVMVMVMTIALAIAMVAGGESGGRGPQAQGMVGRTLPDL
jgi:hypothetical protein